MRTCDESGVAKGERRKPDGSHVSALVGGVVWIVLVAVFGPGRGFFRTIELMFLLGPLVIVPLGLGFVRDEPVVLGRALLQLARRLQPFGAICAVAAFAFPRGWTAATVAAGWAVVTGLIGISGLGRAWEIVMAVRREPRKSFAATNLLEAACSTAAMLFVPVGGIGFVQSRFGATPLGYVEPVVLLVGVHFHFTAFAAPILGGLAIRRGMGKWAERFVAYAVIGATPVVAAGFIFRWPMVKIVGVMWLVAGLLVLSGGVLALLPKIRPRVAQLLLALSALSVIVGMMLAGVYAVGEIMNRDFISIPWMARTHGLLNGIGFCLCGMVGWAAAEQEERRPGRNFALQSLTRRWAV